VVEGQVLALLGHFGLRSELSVLRGEADALQARSGLPCLARSCLLRLWSCSLCSSSLRWPVDHQPVMLQVRIFDDLTAEQ